MLWAFNSCSLYDCKWVPCEWFCQVLLTPKDALCLWSSTVVMASLHLGSWTWENISLSDASWNGNSLTVFFTHSLSFLMDFYFYKLETLRIGVLFSRNLSSAKHTILKSTSIFNSCSPILCTYLVRNFKLSLVFSSPNFTFFTYLCCTFCKPRYEWLQMLCCFEISFYPVKKLVHYS